MAKPKKTQEEITETPETPETEETTEETSQYEQQVEPIKLKPGQRLSTRGNILESA